MILGVSLVLVAFILLRFLFTCPKEIWNRLGPMSRNVLFWSQQVLYWGMLVIGFVFAFLSSVQIGLVTLGCFLVLYNASVSDMKWKAIPILGNSFVQLTGLVIFLIGIILSFIASWKWGVLALAASVVAVIILNILMAIERSIMQKQLIEKENNIQQRPGADSG